MQIKGSSSVIALLGGLIATLLLVGCGNRGPITSSDHPFKTHVIEGCDYLIGENGDRSNARDYSMAITHKGNCRNPIHNHE